MHELGFHFVAAGSVFLFCSVFIPRFFLSVRSGFISRQLTWCAPGLRHGVLPDRNARRFYGQLSAKTGAAARFNGIWILPTRLSVRAGDLVLLSEPDRATVSLAAAATEERLLVTAFSTASQFGFGFDLWDQG